MIVVVCGSARYEGLFREWLHRLVLLGHSPIGLSSYPSDRVGNREDEHEKNLLDLAYLEHIARGDAVLVLNKDGYLGFSTKREVAWARRHQKLVYWLEVEHGYVRPEDSAARFLPDLNRQLELRDPARNVKLP